MSATTQRLDRSPRRWWQFSLRAFFLFALVLGATFGLAGPIVVQLAQQWSPGGAAPAAAPPRAGSLGEFDADGYYESAETPLR